MEPRRRPFLAVAAAVPAPSGVDTSCGSATTVRGKVFDPAGLNPLANVIVFVPNDSSRLPALSPGAPTCESTTSIGDFVTFAITDASGSFVLTGVPVGDGVPITVQTGKWRRTVEMSISKACALPEHVVCERVHGFRGGGRLGRRPGGGSYRAVPDRLDVSAGLGVSTGHPLSTVGHCGGDCRCRWRAAAPSARRRDQRVGSQRSYRGAVDLRRVHGANRRRVNLRRKREGVQRRASDRSGGRWRIGPGARFVQQGGAYRHPPGGNGAPDPDSIDLRWIEPDPGGKGARVPVLRQFYDRFSWLRPVSTPSAPSAIRDGRGLDVPEASYSIPSGAITSSVVATSSASHIGHMRA